MNIINLISDVLVQWGKYGNDILNAAFNSHNKMSFREFIGACSGCDGDWVEIVISGIDKLFPEVYSALPENLGPNALEKLTKVLILCGVEF